MRRRQRRKIQIRFVLGIIAELLGPVIRLEVVPDDLICVRTQHHGSLVVVSSRSARHTSSQKKCRPLGEERESLVRADTSRAVKGEIP